MTNRIPTESGPDSPDSAYRDKRYHPVISRKDITSGDTVESPTTGDRWTVEHISNGMATVRQTDTDTVGRVPDSWFTSVEPVE
jgi:hypothetical protein